MLVIYLIFVAFLFRCVLGLFPFVRIKATYCPRKYLFFCWPLASSGSSGIPTWFSRPCPLAFLRPEPLQGWQYSWQVLRLSEPDPELTVRGRGQEGLTILTSPPPVVIYNSATCEKFSQFVSDTIIQWVTAGVIAVWGPVNHVAPPYMYLVLPLTVEPTKPRLCHDERYLNLWIHDLPLKLDHLCGLPRYALPHHFQTTFDDKNGYQHVLLHSSSQAYFGFQWQGFYFVFRTLPFDWKASAFNYHRLGLTVSGAARSIGLQCRNAVMTATWVSFSPPHFE